MPVGLLGMNTCRFYNKACSVRKPFLADPFNDVFGIFAGDKLAYTGLTVSEDGEYFVNNDIYIFDRPQKVSYALTNTPEFEDRPVWTRDGDIIIRKRLTQTSDANFVRLKLN